MKIYPFVLILASPVLAAAQTLTGPLPSALQQPLPYVSHKAVHPPVPPFPEPAWVKDGPAHPGAMHLRSTTQKVTP